MSTNKTDTNIFVKQNEFSKQNDFVEKNEMTDNKILSKKEIIDSIPKPNFKKRNEDKSKTNIEWRWRFFNIPNKKNELVEISYKHPEKKRKYINQSGEWVEREISLDFDKYVTNEYYHYTDM